MIEFENFNLLYPFALLLPLIFLVCEKFCPVRKEAVIFPHLEIFNNMSHHANSLISILKWSAIVFASIALSSPVIENSFKIDNKDGYDIALLLDTSGSMKEMGFNPQDPRENKFSVVKKSANSFIKKRENDNLAIVVFGEFAFVASPLTYDKHILEDIVQRLYIGMAGEKTAINDAIALSANMMKKSKAKERVAILLTDGMNTAGSIPAKTAIDLAKKADLKIYTIGIGRPGSFDANLLKLIAKESGGEFFYAKNSLILEEVYQKIDELEKSKIEGKKYVKKEYLYIYPLFLAIISLLFYIYLKNRRGA